MLATKGLVAHAGSFSNMVLIEYLYWHFAIAPRNVFEIAANYLRANWHRFLISQHASSLFAPWHRRKPSDLGKTENFEDKIVGGITDFYIRILAAFIRSFIILLGLIVEVLTTIIFIVMFFVWVLWPIIAVGLIGTGINYIL